MRIKYQFGIEINTQVSDGFDPIEITVLNPIGKVLDMNTASGEGYDLTFISVQSNSISNAISDKSLKIFLKKQTVRYFQVISE
ncbi:hypothetical protein HHI36_016452, partial [Cryptolaemus montrouzieri]